MIKGDSWFGSVKAAAEISKNGMEAVLQIKTGHSLFPKQFIEDRLKGCPAGTHIVLKGKHPNGENLIAIGYRYSGKKTLFFVTTEGAGTTEFGEKFEVKYTDRYGNVGKYIFLFNLIYFTC